MIRISPTLASLCAVIGLALVPAAARADQYVVDHCNNFDGTAGGVAFPLVTTPFVSSGEVPKAVVSAPAVDCGVPGGGLHLLLPGQALPADTFARIQLAIPDDRPNITMERVQTEYGAPGWSGGPVFLTIYAFPNGQRTEIVNGQPPARPIVDKPLPPATRVLTWNVFCSAGPCSFVSQSVLDVYRTRLYLNEGVAPTLSVTGGGMTGPGPKAGTQGVTLDAADTDSGVADVTVALDATTVGSLQFACAFKDWSACPRQESTQVVQADTTKVPDGDHELFVRARDAANNVLTRSLGTVTVANGSVSTPNGAVASRLAKLSARFTTTTKRSRTLRFTASPTVKGALLDEGGHPITGATIAILARPRQAGAAAAQIASTQTGAGGAFSAKLPAGPSRTITFAYTAFSTDPRPATTASLKTTVRAILSARIAPRSVRPGRRVTLSGRLALLPRKGIEVKIQARQGRTWRTIDDVRTTKTGSFRWPYRFSAKQARRTYAFRARVASPNYPFAAANSKTALVRVR